MSSSTIFRYYTQTFAYIEEHVLADLDWPDLDSVVQHQKISFAGTRYANVSILPILTCHAVGGDAGQAVPLAAAWVLYDLASNIFDDMQDEDGKSSLWGSWNAGRALNVGLGVVAAAQSCLAGLDASEEAFRDISSLLAHTLLLAARGQTVSLDEPSVENYFEHILAKSGLVFSAITRAGARLGSDDPQVLQQMQDFGLALGTLIQLTDDYADLFSEQGAGDFAVGLNTLPLIYGLAQEAHPLHTRLQELNAGIHALMPAAEEEICHILIEMGAFAHTVAVAKVYQQKALAALASFPEAKVSLLGDYVSKLIPFEPEDW